jgi:undecaprenyl-diphosphatase
MKNLKENQKNLFIGLIGAIAIGISFLLNNIFIILISIISFPALDYVFAAITMLGETYVFIFITIILTIALIMYKRPFKAFILSVVSAFIIQWLLKSIIERPRPYEIGLTIAKVSAFSSSFPSGHTMMFFVIIPVIGKTFPKIRIPLWIIATLVGFSRIYLGVHYFSDVIAGALFGYLIGWAFMTISEKNR